MSTAHRCGAELRWASSTDIGRVRLENQDAVFGDSDAGLFVVADGLAGEQAGAMAANAVVELLPKLILSRLQRLPRPRSRAIRYSMSREIRRLSETLQSTSAARLEYFGMGATVVTALFDRGRVHLAHVGDSRAYLFRGGRLQQLTEDHSVVGILMQLGHITAIEAVDHPARSRLTRFVGMKGEAYADTRTIDLLPGDRLVLCTDGLTGMVSDAEIGELIERHSDAAAVCDALIDAANAAGGRDNVTVLVVNAGCASC